MVCIAYMDYESNPMVVLTSVSVCFIVESFAETAKKTGPYGMRAPWYTKFRRLHMMLKAHWAPFNSGLTAGEALTNPFFGGGAPPRAKLPVCVEAAFPRS